MSKSIAPLVDHLYQLSFLLQDRLARVAAAHGLSPISVRLLGILRDREPGMNDLAQYLRVEKSSLTGLTDRAAKRGLVERVQSKDDRRSATVRLTAKGAKLARTIADDVAAEVAALVAELPEAEQKRLSALIGKVVAPTVRLPVKS